MTSKNKSHRATTCGISRNTRREDFRSAPFRDELETDGELKPRGVALLARIILTGGMPRHVFVLQRQLLGFDMENIGVDVLDICFGI